MDYEVDYAVLQVASSRATAIAGAAAAGLAELRIDGVGAAIPGGVSGAVADKLDQSWVGNAAELAEAFDGYAEALTATSANYRDIEDAATDNVTGFFGDSA